MNTTSYLLGLALLGVVGFGIGLLAVFLLSPVKSIESSTEETTISTIPKEVTKFYDLEENATCWIYKDRNRGSIFCIPNKALK